MTRGMRIELITVFVVLLWGLNASAQKTLQGTYIDDITTTSTTIPAATLTAIGTPITVTCTPSFKIGCTVVADMWAAAGGGNTSGSQYELCLLVDGVRAQAYCYGYQGMIPADGTYVTATNSQSLGGLASGTHTVQTYFWCRYGCSVVSRHTNYYLYSN